MEKIKLPDFFNKGSAPLLINYQKYDKTENQSDIIICKCGCNDFKVFITAIIDDARIYCSKCGAEQ